MRPVSSTLFVVLCEPPAEQEAEFNEWYDTVHGPDALENGSFTAMRRYRAVGPGRCTAHYVNLWDGNYGSEKEAWAYIQPRAEELRARGRVTDISGVVWASMMLAVPTDGDGRADTSTLTTVQSDFRAPEATPDPQAWLRASGLDRMIGERAPGASHAVFASDPAGRGAGYNLALFESVDSVADAVSAWEGVGEAGVSPTPPYTTIFDTNVSDGAAEADEPPVATAWTMHWELITGMSV